MDEVKIQALIEAQKKAEAVAVWVRKHWPSDRAIDVAVANFNWLTRREREIYGE